MDKDLRNLLFGTTQAIRRLLEEEFSLQLEGTFDVHADGRVAEQPGAQLSATERLVRGRIVEAIQHRLAVGESAAEAVRGFQSEAVFTFLNRLAALKMMEARALVLPCVSHGDQSQGFKEFSGLAPGLIELPDKGYRLYLECLFDEIGREVGVLFDRTDAASQLWPRRKALESVLAKLNTPELAGVWAEDETIGWIYQYYNDPDERRQMREESSAPRNSRELAVRNQFFTPRYVVEFLTDNTLGRIWYEMTKGQTRLKDQCRYLVRRPKEIFLADGEAAPKPNPDAEPGNLSQEELLKQPVYVPHRPLKDPRELRMIDPACGSMHFGLYAFDLFTVIYDEAWEMAHGMDAATKSAKTFAPFFTFAASFSDKASFLREVPRLIVEHNIHGIDIDPRAAQIAGLALWLRAQRAWQALGLKPSDRPTIRRSNIVCAEPMPGERELLREFVDRQFPPGERTLFQSFLENVWDKMRLAGEAGSLLKIEEEIRSAIEEAREAWRKLSARPMELFSTTELNRISSAPELTGMDQAVLSLTTARTSMGADFWEELEERIYNALRDYAKQAQSGGGFQRRLFAEDAARGFAFIDVCRKRYDVALMNPPFGEVPTTVADYSTGRYPHWIDNILCAFIARGWQMTESQGTVGVIFDRTAIVKSSYEDFRRHVLLATNRISALADTGWEVLDANVETTCLALDRLPEEQTSLFFDVRRMPTNEKDRALNGFLEHSREATLSEGITLAWPLSFNRLPNAVLGYDFPEFLKLAFSAFDGLGDSGFTAYQGHALEAEVHYRAWWELPHPTPQNPISDWAFAFKGGDYSPFYLVSSDVAFYGKRGSRVPDSTANVLRNLNFQQLPGVAFGKRGEFLDAQPLPRGSIFTHEGHAIPNLSAHDSWFVLAVLNTAFFSVALNTFCGQHKTSGYVNLFPLAPFDAVQRAQLAELAKAIHDKKAAWYRGEEQNPHFTVVYSADTSRGHGGFTELIRSTLSALKTSDDFLKEAESTIEDSVRSAYRLTDSEQGWVQRGCESRPQDATWYGRKEISSANAIIELATSHVSYWLGCSFGRWDIRYATGEQAAPELPDPFAPLPVCPPGQLQNAQGLPARPEDVPAAYPVCIPWDGILVDDPNHPLDLERRVREVIEIIWNGREGGPTAEAIEHEACEILGVKSLRDYFRKPAGFFADHLKRYSKSRRQAPIYWPLSSPNGLYTVWLYYHRLTADTLFTVLRDYLKPKLEFEERRAFQLRQEAGNTPSPSQRRDIAEAEELVEDLRAFKAELERVAPLFRPNLNDGVIINYAPLWRMIGLPKWRKDCQATWNELARGDYDWAHLAMHLWPERVVPKCATDRSLAIAHGLESVFWQEDPEKPGKWITRKVADQELRGLIAERTSAAVKAAVESLVGATGNEGAPRRGRKGAKA